MKNQLKFYELIALALLLICGSFFVFFATNLLMSDFYNGLNQSRDFQFVSSIPYVSFMVEIVALFTFIVHFIPLEDNEKHYFFRFYAVFFTICSVIGVLASLFTGLFIYHSFVNAYPFQAGTLTMLLLHILVIIINSIVIYQCNKKITKNDVKPHRPKGYWLSAVLGVAFLYYSLDRFGALLWSPLYGEFSNFYLLWPLYLWLLTPIVMLFMILSYRFTPYKHASPKVLLISNIAVLVLTIGLAVAVGVIASLNPSFLSAASPALPLIRYCSFPIDYLIMIICTIGLPLVGLIRNLRLRHIRKLDTLKHIDEKRY